MKTTPATAHALLMLVVASALGGCFEAGEDPTADPPTVGDAARGALVYEDWTSTAAGGTGVLPAGESHPDYVRCVACHGWDQLGADGGYVRRIRSETQPNAGYGDTLNTASRNISTGSFGEVAEVTEDEILNAGGRSWTEGSGSWNGGSAEGFAKGNEHPDYTQSGSLSETQLADVITFLNDSTLRVDQVFADIDATADPVLYTLMDSADTSRGESYYALYCISCHGAPDADSTGLTNERPGLGGFVAFLGEDGAYGKFMHRMLWGAPGTAMTRSAVGNPTAADVADVLAYIEIFEPVPVDPAPDDGGLSPDAQAGKEMWDGVCSNCHGVWFPSDPSRITNDMGSIDYEMSGLSLTDEEIRQLLAYFDEAGM